jgi:hypothetical protein
MMLRFHEPDLEGVVRRSTRSTILTAVVTGALLLPATSEVATASPISAVTATAPVAQQAPSFWQRLFERWRASAPAPAPAPAPTPTPLPAPTPQPGPAPAPTPTPTGGCGSGSYDAEAVRNGSTWTSTARGRNVYSGGDMRAAVQAAIGGLDGGRSTKQWVVVRGSGSIGAGERISLPSHTGLDVCGEITVTGSGSGDMAPVYARDARNVEVRNLAVRGRPNYGVFFRDVSDVTLGRLDIRVSSGLGVRIDNHGRRAEKARNVRIDEVYVSGTSAHGVETYGVDGLTIGRVTARNTGGSGLLLNDTINATVGTVDAEGAGTGTGYAAFRMANRNGRVGNGYPTNIRVGNVIARGGGRGIFCVSESGGAVIDRVDIAGTGSNAILVENCYNVTIAGQSGTISGGGEIRIAARNEFAPSSDIVFQNLTVRNVDIRQSPCNGRGNVLRNIDQSGGSRTWC